MPSSEPTQGRGRPRTNEYPKKLGPSRVTTETWDLLDRAAAHSGQTKREIIENGVAGECRRLLEAPAPAPAQPIEGTTEDVSQASGQGRAEVAAV